MSKLNLSTTKIYFSFISTAIKITAIELSYIPLTSPPMLSEINIKLYNSSTGEFESYSNSHGRLYYISNSTITACTINFINNYELSQHSTILMELSKIPVGELLPQTDIIFVNLYDLINNGSFIKEKPCVLPSTPGDYFIQLHQINEIVVDMKNLYSSKISVGYPIKKADIFIDNTTENRTSTNTSFRIYNARNKNNELTTAAYIAILRVKIN